MVRARSFGSIRRLPSGKYQARYWHLGKQIAAEHTFAAKTDVRRWLSTVEADMVRGDWLLTVWTCDDRQMARSLTGNEAEVLTA